MNELLQVNARDNKRYINKLISSWMTRSTNFSFDKKVENVHNYIDFISSGMKSCVCLGMLLLTSL